MLRLWVTATLAALFFLGGVLPTVARPFRSRRASRIVPHFRRFRAHHWTTRRPLRVRHRYPVRRRYPGRRRQPARVRYRALAHAHVGAAQVHQVLVDRRSITGLQPPAARCMAAALLAFRKAGVIYSISSVRRSRADQARLYRRRRRSRYPVAPPGSSMHERGLAIDLTFTARGTIGRQIMHAHGFTQPVRHDPVHWEARHNPRNQATGC